MNTDFEKRLDRVQNYQGVDDRFTFQIFGDTIDTLIDLMVDEEMLARFHNENALYLYRVFERETYIKIVKSNTIKVPVKLYETVQSAIEASKNANFQEPVMVRFALELNLPSNMYYDYFNGLSEVDTKTQVQDKAKQNIYWERTLDKIHSTNKDGKQRSRIVIVYKVYNPRAILSVQCI